MDIEYSPDEFNAYLGLYQHWLQGDPAKQIDKTFCFSAFQFHSNHDGYVHQTPYHKYAEYLKVSVDSIMQNLDEWYVRIYIDESILTSQNPDHTLWISIIQSFAIYDRVQIICIKMPRYFDEKSRSHEGLLAVLFRYLGLFDQNTNIMLFRDIDNVWTEQHQYFTDLWISRGDDVCVFLNQNYKRQEIVDLTPTGLILSDEYFNTLLSGLWNIRIPFGVSLSPVIWQRIFGYIESYTTFVFKPEYQNYLYYGIRFAYGFDELAISRVVVPVLIQQNMKFYAIPIKIYEPEYFSNMFNAPIVKKFIRELSDPATMKIVEQIMINNYWHMDVENSGLSQYIVCILTSIFFKIITDQDKSYSSAWFINALKTQIYPTLLLMGVGLFTFQNFDRYNWYPNKKSAGGAAVVKAFIEDNKKISLADWTANSDLTNSGDGHTIPSPPPPPYYYGM